MSITLSPCKESKESVCSIIRQDIYVLSAIPTVYLSFYLNMTTLSSHCFSENCILVRIEKILTQHFRLLAV